MNSPSKNEESFFNINNNLISHRQIRNNHGLFSSGLTTNTHATISSKKYRIVGGSVPPR